MQYAVSKIIHCSKKQNTHNVGSCSCICLSKDTTDFDKMLHPDLH